MSIYIPFTYIIGWSSLNTYYYGRKTAKGCHPSDLWKNYFTSSNYVKDFRKLHGEPDIIQIRKTFPNNPDACKLWESKVLEKLDAQHDPRFLNKKNGDHKWDTTGIVIVTDAMGNNIAISINDPRYISKELLPKKQSKTHIEKRFSKKLKCSHCKNIFDPGNYTKNHGDNCKLNPNYIPKPKKELPKFTCEFCGKIIGGKSNLIQHQNGPKCIKNEYY